MHVSTHEKHGGMQFLNNTFLKESVFSTLQTKEPTDPAASQLSGAEVTTHRTRSSGSTCSQYGNGAQGELPPEGSRISSGCESAQPNSVSGFASESVSSSRGGHTGGMGKSYSSVGQTPESVLRQDLRHRPDVCEPTLKPSSSILMGTEPQLYSRHRRAASNEKQQEETKKAGYQMPITPNVNPEMASLTRSEKVHHG